jgi:RNA polymerase sigma-70 factor (ECF subfamily)
VTVRTSRNLRTRLATDLDAAFPSFVAAHIDGIYSGVRRLVPNESDAEDLTQETFIRAYRALRSYESDRVTDLRLRPWLWTIAINLARSAARRRSRRVTEVGLAAAHETTPGPAATEPEALEAVTAIEWAQRLATLSDAQRTAVVLRHVVDLPYAEIAAITGRPIGTVKADVHRGVERLRKLITDEPARLEERSS